jgi:hypothetical protein
MEIYFSRYKLKPLKRPNRLSSFEDKEGVYLMAKDKGVPVYADYFPHLPLGDVPVDHFLENFKDQSDEYDKKVFSLLLKDRDYQKKESLTFQNHQLWTGTEILNSGIVKYKLLTPSDTAFLEPLKRGLRVRLDANGMFSPESFKAFLSLIPQEHLKLIDYIEDPIRNHNWEGLEIPTARDFLTSEKYDYYVYKPNCEFRPKTDAKIIYSAYLGSELGAWHTYCEMMESADFSLTHGIVGQGFYKEERGLFKGDFESGVYPDTNVVKNIYQELILRNWKRLCSI